MKYFLSAGEASGDLHASHLMQAILERDTEAEFCFIGGGMMQTVGGRCVMHYKDLAYMGIIPVLTHLPQILQGMSRCKKAIRAWRPDVVILVDYPGFNLQLAKFVHKELRTPVYYYISPKIWAWKEYRIKDIRKHVTRLFSILPFEVDFFEKKHHYPISYVGNPTVDEVVAFKADYHESAADFCARNHLPVDRKIIAILAGSRAQEIRNNLVRMYEAAKPWTTRGYQLVIAGAPSQQRATYEKFLPALRDENSDTTIVFGETYALLSHASAALVTSGTATLETALFGVPQVVCYYMAAGRLVSWLRKRVLKVRFVSLVNLVCDREVVPELVADGMTVENAARHLAAVLSGGEAREEQLAGYAEMCRRLGEPGAPKRAAEEMVATLRKAPSPKERSLR